MRTAQMVRAREVKFEDRIGIGIWTCTRTDFAVVAVVRAVSAARAFIYQHISMEFKYFVY